MKALFIPLAGHWFDALACGAKSVEYRRAGPRWNARTCAVGRRVVLSRGYSGARLTGVVTHYHEVPCFKAALAIYPDAPVLAAIGIRLDARSRSLRQTKSVGLGPLFIGGKLKAGKPI
jgi:hypothetical protein